MGNNDLKLQPSSPHRTREELEVILHGIDDGISTQDASGRLLYANNAAARFVGFANAEEFLAAPIEEVLAKFEIYDEEGNPLSPAQLPGRVALQEGKPAEIMVRFRIRETQEERWSTVRATPVFDSEGKVRFAVNIFRDITEQKRSEQIQNALHEVTRVLTGSGSLDEGIRDVLAAVCRSLTWDAGEFWQVDREADYLCCTEFWSSPGVELVEFEKETRERTFQRGEGLPGRVWVSGMPEWITDISHNGNFPRALVATREGLHGAFGFPIEIEGEILGVINFYSRHIYPPNRDMMNMGIAIGSQCGQFLERKRAEQNLRESEQNYRIVAESASDAIITIDASSTILYINAAAAKIFGYATEEMLGGNLEMLMPEHLRHIHRAALDRYNTTGVRHIAWERVELPGRHKSGREIPLELSFGESVRGGRKVFTGIVRDITERRTAEQRLEFLASASEVLSSSLDYHATLRSVARLAVPHIADWCSIDMLDEKGAIKGLAVTHVDLAKIEWAHELQRRYPPDPSAPLGVPNVIRTGRSEFYPLITDEMLVAAARTEEELRIGREVGYTSVMIVPLVVREKPVGAITFVSAESGRCYTESDLALAEDLARRAAVAIDNTWLHHAVQEQREWLQVTLASIGDAVITTDIDGRITFMNPVAQTLTRWHLDDALGRDLPAVFAIVNEESRAVVENPVEKVLRSGLVVGLANHTVLIARDGTEIPIDDSAAPIRDANGKMIGVVMVFHDITDRRRAERERAELLAREREARNEAERSEQRYRELAEAMPQIVWTATPEGHVQYLNRRWYEYTGMREEDLELFHENFPIHPDDQAINSRRLEEAYRTGAVYDMEIRLRRHDGAYRWHLARSIPIRDAEGRIVQWIGTSTDIDDRKHSETRLHFLAEASEILASSLDYEATLRSVTRLAVPHIGDWCSVDMLGDNGEIERLAVAHVDPAKVEWAHELQRRYPPDPNAPTGVPNVIRTGRPEFIPVITEEMILAGVKNQEELDLVREIGFTAMMVVPLLVRGRSIGAITFVSAEAGRHYTDADLALAEDLARRAAVAIDNAWLYRTAQEEIDERRHAEEQLRASERRFRLMIEQSPLSVQIFNSNGDVLSVNAAWEELWGVSREAVMGYNILNDPQLEDKGIAPYIRRAFQGESLQTPPVSYNPADIGRPGRIRWVRGFLYPVTDESGEIQETVLLLEDITEQRRIEEALRESEARFRSMADSSPVLIWMAGPDGQFSYVNKTWLDFTGRPLDRELAEGWESLMHPEDQERSITTYWWAFRNRERLQMEYRMLNYRGEYRWIIDTGIPHFAFDGEFIGFIGSCIDITDRKEVEIELTKAKDAAEAANQAKDRFLAVLSHELRTPLTPVLTLTHALKEDDLPDDIRMFVEIVDRNIELEARLIDDLLDLTRIEKGKLQLNMEIVDAHVLMGNVLEIYKSEILEKGLRLTIEPQAAHHHVRADSARLQQIFWNLVKNAVKFTPHGGAITIRTGNRTPEHLRIEVADTGIGIPPEMLPLIFTAFEQGDQRITRQFGGLGLGLAISKALVEMHGGRLTAASEGSDMGSTFTLEISTAQPGRGAHSPEVPDAVGTEPERKRSRKILLVDDHEDTSTVMRTLLERRGYRVTTAATMQAGIDAACAERFDFLISDIGLPDGTGVEMMIRIRELGIELPGIALSGFGMEEDVRRSREAGFLDHLTKPVSFQKLQALIEKYMEKA